MKFLADECVDRQIVDRLRHDGYTVLCVAEMEPGISDPEVLNMVNQEEAILLTADKDFGELVFRQDKVALHRRRMGVLQCGRRARVLVGAASGIYSC